LKSVRTTNNPWLHRFAVFTAAATLVLIGLGGLVTSHSAGMAVPDWPTTYGYNMFFFPFSQWIGGVFYEHTHRLFASAVGFLTIILATWLWLKESRRWLRWLGCLALFLVIAQGVLGGLRVVLFKDQIGIFHATLAQVFLVLLAFIAVFTSRRWTGLAASSGPSRLQPRTRWLIMATTILVFLQLALGATMRHQHNGLAVPDFPLAYGQIWPPTDPESLEVINQHRVDVRDYGPLTSVQIQLHMLHRILAGVILSAVIGAAWLVGRQLGWSSALAKLSFLWIGLVLGQGLLGAMTVWSNKAADVATAHVTLGAVILVLGSIFTLVAFHPAFADRHRKSFLAAPHPTLASPGRTSPAGQIA
jgi:cytochrome c oxidase assembly protein subunit 15